MKDKDFIASKFNEENITAPDSISEEAIKARLDSGTSANDMLKVKANKKRVFKPIVAAAACFAVVIGSLVTASTIHEHKLEQAIDSRIDKGIVHFTSYDELKTFTGKLDIDRFEGGVVKDFNVFSKSDAAVDAEASSDGGSSSFSETYKQVDGVDEADIVKTDGEYIYVLDDETELAVYSAKNGKTKSAGKVFFDTEEAYFSEMFLDGDRIFAVGNKYDNEKTKTVVVTVDINNKKDPKIAGTYEQSGSYKTARMTDGCLYVISNTYIYSKKFVPYCTDADGEYKKIPAENISAFECCQQPEYVVVGAIDTNGGKNKKQKTKAIIGGAENVYCNTENLYVACTDYRNGKTRTDIIKYSLDGIDVKEKAFGSVKGYVNNQWSFDEKDGNLRVATTSEKNGEEINKLYILDSDLQTIGSVGGYAKGEHIEAVKYIGDMAYVITYETTDPLFIIDLSDPKNPQITGAVKIDGFSTNLVPIGDDMLMGIGYATEETEWGGEATSGVKLVLFDISDKNNPQVLDEKVFDNSFSSAQYNHKAILQNKDKGYLAIPMTWDSYYDSYDEWGEKGGGIAFTEENGKIKVLMEYKYGEATERLVYIDDYIYTVGTYSSDIGSFSLKK